MKIFGDTRGLINLLLTWKKTIA